MALLCTYRATLIALLACITFEGVDVALYQSSPDLIAVGLKDSKIAISLFYPFNESVYQLASEIMPRCN